MSDYLTATDVTETFMRLVPTRTVEWADGSGAAEYAEPPVIVLWDSGSNPIVSAVSSAEHADRVWEELIERPAEEWDLVWFCTLCSYPDEPMTEGDFTHMMGNG